MKGLSGRSMRTFSLIWFGQLISLIGSELTGFALGVWVYLQTGSIVQFALIAFFTALPGTLLLPFAGALIDRWNRRLVLIVSDTGAAISTSILAILFLTKQIEVWHIYVAMTVSSICNSFQWPAFSAAITQLVPKKQLGRANGMLQFAQALAQLIAPVLGGFLVTIIQPAGVIFVDMATFLFGVAATALIRIPDLADDEERPAKPSLLREAAAGWRYISARSGLLTLLLLFALSNAVLGFVQVLIPPLVLDFASPAALGRVVSFAGLGMLIGGIVMIAWKGPKAHIKLILIGTFLQGAIFLLSALPPSLIIIAVMGFVILMSMAIIVSSSQTIWQKKVPPKMQGRTFAIRRMIARSTLPLAYLAAGPLVNTLFRPALSEGGALAGSVGKVIGVGPSRGIAFFFIILGILLIGAAIFGFLYPPLRDLEHAIPDAIPDDEPAEMTVPQTTQATA
jgi:MFS transporter, DHA3 family, macrolide efflux protein